MSNVLNCKTLSLINGTTVYYGGNSLKTVSDDIYTVIKAWRETFGLEGIIVLTLSKQDYLYVEAINRIKQAFIENDIIYIDRSDIVNFELLYVSESIINDHKKAFEELS